MTRSETDSPDGDLAPDQGDSVRETDTTPAEEDASAWVVGGEADAPQEEKPGSGSLTSEWELAALEVAVAEQAGAAGGSDPGDAAEVGAAVPETPSPAKQPRRMRMLSRRRKRREEAADEDEPTPQLGEAAGEAARDEQESDSARVAVDPTLAESIGELRARIARIEDSVSSELSRSHDRMIRELEPIARELAGSEERLSELERHLDALGSVQGETGRLAAQLGPAAERLAETQESLGGLSELASQIEELRGTGKAGLSELASQIEELRGAGGAGRERVERVEQRLGKVEARLNQLGSAERATQKRLKRLEPLLTELRTSHREAEARGTRLESRIAEVEMSQRLNEELAHVFRRRPPRGAPPPDQEDRLDLNSASFEELRETGLSVTQAVRVISRRESGGGYDSLDELDQLQGFSPDQLDSLKSRVRV